MIRKIAVVLLVAAAAFLAYVATRPGSYRVERSITISAAPEKVFPLVADLRRMGEWSPWEKLDPQMKKDFAGEPGQPGSSYRWAGNEQVGEGRMTLRETAAPSRVTYELEFLKPYQSVATTSFRLSPEVERTTVSWSMEGRLGFTEKLFGVFMDMNEMIAKDFDEGLASLKEVAERPPEAPAATEAQPAEGEGG